jgi:hypothetical protein
MQRKGSSCTFVPTKRNEREDRFVAKCGREKVSSVARDVEAGF